LLKQKEVDDHDDAERRRRRARDDDADDAEPAEGMNRRRALVGDDCADRRVAASRARGRRETSLAARPARRVA
jgi:hypothetical protein